VSSDGRTSKAYVGYYFEEDKWDGSDIFRVNHDIIVKRSVRDALLKTKIRNVDFIALPEEETNVLAYYKSGSKKDQI
jgi:hypothetical protein